MKEYYVVCFASKEYFELSREWGGLKLRRTDAEEFAHHVEDCWNSGLREPGLEEYARNVGLNLWFWCEERNWDVKLCSDHDPDDTWLDFQLSGSRYNLIVNGVVFPFECPKNCPFTDDISLYGQNAICGRCPLFCCSGAEPLVSPGQYRIDWAKAWKAWFDGGMRDVPDLRFEPPKEESS